MTTPSQKPCSTCGKYLPYNADNFKRYKTGKLDVRCLLCRRDKLRGKAKLAVVRSMADIETGAVNSFLAAATSGGENIPHSSELLERLMEYFGGTSGFTALVVKQFFDAPPGSSGRSKMIEAVVRLVTKNTELGGAKKPMGQWSDEELEAELDSRLKVVAAQFQGRIVDGQIQTQATSGPTTAAIGSAIRVLSGIPAPGAPSRSRRAKNRSPKAVQADSDAGADT